MSPLLRALAALSLAACTDGALTLADMAEPDVYVALDPGPAALRRLTGAQRSNALRDLFGEDVVLPPVSEPDVSQGGLLSVGATSSTYSPRGVESFESAAFQIAAQVRHDRLPGAAGTCDLQDATCVSDVIAAWGRRIWRRPLSTDERGRLEGIAQASAAALGSPAQGVSYAIAAMLQSPNFLYRVELGQPGEGARDLTDLELATRLAFFLWNTTPDDELLAAAEAGELSSPEGLFDRAAAMLDDPRARTGLRNLFSESLQLYELDHLTKDPVAFEHFSTELGPDAREETLRLLEYASLDAEWDYRDVFTTRESFINPRLAAIYGVPAPAEGSFAPITFPESAQRAGLLSHASFLNLHAHALSSSATRRGEAVRVQLLCQAIPAPPVNVDTSIPEPSGAALTLRDRVAEHLTEPTCAGCHLLTDPIGLGLENYDALGRWRDLDNGAVIDPTGELDGVPFNNPQELGEALANHPTLPGCLVRTMGRYATGRVETAEERAWLKALTERFVAHGHQVRPLILELVMSPLFRQVGPPADTLPTEEQ
jgi:hypothetical protein